MSGVWDSHRIRRTRPGVVSGRPLVLYHWPELQGAENFINNVNPEDMVESKTVCIFRQTRHCQDDDMYDMCIEIMAEKSLTWPSDAYQALDLYKCIRESILSRL